METEEITKLVDGIYKALLEWRQGQQWVLHEARDVPGAVGDTRRIGVLPPLSRYPARIHAIAHASTRPAARPRALVRGAPSIAHRPRPSPHATAEAQFRRRCVRLESTRLVKVSWDETGLFQVRPKCPLVSEQRAMR
ncbi:Protein of unknown function [Gryllus bimaculatus]|nr:Protein of unknown function [Gryllus bimaculatus]